MLRILDRYVIKEVITPFFLALILFTFILQVDPLMDVAKDLIEKGVGGWTILRLLATLIPQALGITIPISLLVGLLIGLGRLSADREAVALQACGVSLLRLLRPVGAVVLVGWAVTSYVMIWSIPAGNKRFQEILHDIVTARLETQIKPRVFFEDFANLTLFARDVPSGGGGWRDVFLADQRDPKRPQILLARRGRLNIDTKSQRVDFILEDGSQHRPDADDPTRYEVQRFAVQTVGLDPKTVFPDTRVIHRAPEMTIGELRAEIASKRAKKLSPHNEVMFIQQKFSIPVACFVFGLLALVLGVSNSKDSKNASFVVGLVVVVIYWMLMYLGQATARAHWIPAELAMWIPDIGLGLAGIGLLIWRHRHADAGVQISPPSLVTIRRSFQRLVPRPGRRAPATPASTSDSPARAAASASRQAPDAATRRAGARVVIRVPHGVAPSFRILDSYVSRAYLRVLMLAFCGMLGIFYIFCFIDWSDNLFKGQATGQQLAQFMWYSTPQYVYYVLPLSALVATLVTIGVLTKSSELIVMRACGVSLYRTALPLVLFSLVWSGALFGIEESVLAASNRHAAELKHLMRGGQPRTFNVLNRQWVTGRDERLYHYTYFDPRQRILSELEVYRFDPVNWRVVERLQARQVDWRDGRWEARDGWVRTFSNAVVNRYEPFAQRVLNIESPEYFGTEQPDAERMSFTELRTYVSSLKVSGFDVIPFTVALHRKVSFPFVALVMTLIAVPFAVTTGRRGALYGIGLGILLAISYWGLFAVFTAIGSAGMLAPILAAWAPNILFLSTATYLLLTVRT
jgi:LPS export ABC transporter permease LptG/LPS export ABC transporter permease LptF